jgi:hypothetical protein
MFIDVSEEHDPDIFRDSSAMKMEAAPSFERTGNIYIHICIRLHGVTFQKTIIFTGTAVITLNLIL